jgi:hypothetical protein
MTQVVNMKTTIKTSSLILAIAAFFMLAPAAHAQSQTNVISPSSTRTWMPAFKREQTVYLDPALGSHPSAPFKFSPEFKSKLSQNTTASFYVIGAQQGNEAIPEGTKLGTAKADELLPRWTNQPDFDKERYAIIFWVRRSDNPIHGSVGVNVGSKLRSLGVTTDLIDSPTGIVIPALKEYMPADPEDAILKIAQNIDKRASQAILEQQRQVAQVTQTQEEKVAFQKDVATFIDIAMRIISVGCVGGAGFILFRWRKNVRIKAQRLLNQWDVAIQNGADLYLELTESYVTKLEGIKWGKADERFRQQYQTATASLARFIELWSQGKDILEKAQTHFDNGNFRRFIKTLNEKTIEITGDALPIEVTNLLAGRIETKTYPAKAFVKEIDSAYSDARDRIVKLLEIHDNAVKLSENRKAFSEKIDAIEQQISTPVEFKHNLSFGQSSPDLKEIPILYECKSAIANARASLQLALEALKTSNFSQIADSLEMMRKNLEIAKTERQGQIDAYRLCDDKSRELIQAFTSIEQHITQAQGTISEIQVEFPAYNLTNHFSMIEKGQYILSQRESCLEDLERVYLNHHFEKFKRQTQLVMDEIVLLESECKNLNRLPERLRRLQSDYSEQLKRYQYRASKMVGFKKIGIDFEELNQAILLGNFMDLAKRLSKVRSEIIELEHLYGLTLHSSSSQWSSSNYSSSDSSWSSGSGSSWSSGSDYGSSSGGGDYGSSSGGGDYGGSSGGGSY